jgi:NitT/TauT family transport system permease protein
MGMNQRARLFKTYLRGKRLFTWGDLIVLACVAVLIYVASQLAFHAPAIIRGPQITLQPSALPFYALLSLGRMAAAYALSILFTLIYGRMAAYHRNAERVLMPLLDVLQSVPILSFLPVVLLGLSAFLPENNAAELASIILIFTSQAWNLTFAWYQALTTIPKELREASSIFRLNPWFRFRRLELPFAAISLIWNSMVSWAGGWFFLMAAEIFTIGNRDFRLPGLGAYLQEAATQGNFRAIAWGVATLILLIVLLDQFIWRPLLAWSERFKIEMIENDNPPTSWFYDNLRNAQLISWLGSHVGKPLMERLDSWTMNKSDLAADNEETELPIRRGVNILFLSLLILALAYGMFRAGQFLMLIQATEWAGIAIGLLATLFRVFIALIIALLWTIPVGVLIGTNPRLAAVLQPLVQIAASVPATALFPVFLLFLLGAPGGLNLAAILLMLMGTQWYLLFNIIAGASAIPQDLKYTARLLQLRNWEQWRRLILPALFPYLVTGSITASGGAWNASILAEWVLFRGQVLKTTGIGSTIAQATASGNYPVLLGATLSMILTVILINRLLWQRMYRLAEEKYRME